MLYCRPDRFDPTGETVSFDAAPAIRVAPSEKATMLRARAVRYRDLATALYNENLVAEVESLARELEAEAARLDIGRYAFFQAVWRKTG